MKSDRPPNKRLQPAAAGAIMSRYGMKRLEGARVVVVGGSSGIGLATAKRTLD